MSQQGKWRSGTGLTCLCVSPESQRRLYHQNSDRLHCYCLRHLRLHSKIICHCLEKGQWRKTCNPLPAFCASLPSKAFLHHTNGVAAVARKSLGLFPRHGAFNCIQPWHLYKHRQQKLCMGPPSRRCQAHCFWQPCSPCPLLRWPECTKWAGPLKAKLCSSSGSRSWASCPWRYQGAAWIKAFLFNGELNAWITGGSMGQVGLAFPTVCLRRGHRKEKETGYLVQHLIWLCNSTTVSFWRVFLT